MRSSIIDKGIRATNFFSSVINEQSLQTLTDQLEKQLGKKVEIGLSTFKR
jgi:hypothetical protein